MRKALLAIVIGLVATVLGAGPALACGGLIGRNGSVNLVKTTTLAAWHDGVEHYVTAFKFAGAGGEFGSIIPLPDVPTSVERGGDWTLQRLVREVTPQPAFARAESCAASGAPGRRRPGPPRDPHRRPRHHRPQGRRPGGGGVGHQERLPPHPRHAGGPRLLRPPQPHLPGRPLQRRGRPGQGRGRRRRHARSTSPSRPRSRGCRCASSASASSRPSASAPTCSCSPTSGPTLLPGDSAPGLALDRPERATSRLLTDLRTDKGMEWMPESMWLSYLKVDALPSQLTYDLAVDATGAGQPSAIAAGYATPGPAPPARRDHRRRKHSGRCRGPWPAPPRWPWRPAECWWPAGDEAGGGGPAGRRRGPHRLRRRPGRPSGPSSSPCTTPASRWTSCTSAPARPSGSCSATPTPSPTS